MPPQTMLPLELYDRILDFVASLDAGGHALRACALTCRTWLPRCRYHLFYHVKLNSFASYDRFDGVLGADPGIAHYVRALDFEIGRGIQLFDHNRVLPISILSRLSSLQTLKYYSALTAQTPRLRMQIANLPTMTTLTTFVIHVCVFQRFSDMITLLAAFPCLRILRLFEVFFVDREYRSYLTDGRCALNLPLSSLHLASLHEAPALFGWLAETSSINQLATLSVGLDSLERVKDFSAFLRLCGASINHLSLRSRSLVENKFHGVNLSHNTHIRSLSLRFLFLRDIQWFPALLSTISSHYLLRISIRLLPRGDSQAVKEILKDLELVDCAPLDALLTSPQFSSLNMVVFDFGCPIGSTEIQSVLVQRMPLLYARGCISVDHETS